MMSTMLVSSFVGDAKPQEGWPLLSSSNDIRLCRDTEHGFPFQVHCTRSGVDEGVDRSSISGKIYE